MVESEEALDAEMAAAEDFLVQPGAKFLKIFQAIRHGSSGVISRTGRADRGAIMNELSVQRERVRYRF
jgi:hypothetical protein